MTTTSQTAPTASVAVDNFFTEKETIWFGFDISVEKDKDGNEKKVKTVAIHTPEEADKLQKEGKFDASKGGAVDVLVKYPKTVDGLLELYKNAENQEELVLNHNRGAKTKVNNRIRAKLTAVGDDGEFLLDEKDLTQDPTNPENSYLDMTGAITAKTERRQLSEEEKFDRNMELIGIVKGTPKYDKMKALWRSSNVAE